ncbi:hypothetical protein DY000_02015637 [Brassica cretica]|uniref:Uncharacterized protein n=1 Tax=Brassica cretica TaxID=69181 RepID=A0ABQ7CSB2_BRACR|nr:hypothetical protein DY000_02015637 [Brassica cretica]
MKLLEGKLDEINFSQDFMREDFSQRLEDVEETIHARLRMQQGCIGNLQNMMLVNEVDKEILKNQWTRGDKAIRSFIAYRPMRPSRHRPTVQYQHRSIDTLLCRSTSNISGQWCRFALAVDDLFFLTLLAPGWHSGCSALSRTVTRLVRYREQSLRLFRVKISRLHCVLSFLFQLVYLQSNAIQTSGQYDQFLNFDDQNFSKARILQLSKDLGRVGTKLALEPYPTDCPDRAATVLLLTAKEPLGSDEPGR